MDEKQLEERVVDEMGKVADGEQRKGGKFGMSSMTRSVVEGASKKGGAGNEKRTRTI